MLPHDRKRADQCFQTRIVLTFDRKFTLPRGNGDERVVCAGVAVNRDAVKTRVSYTLGDLGQYVRRHARIGGNKTQHCGHARLNHARPLADARHRDELTVNEHLRGKRLLHGVGGHDGLRCLDPIVRSKIVDRLGKSCQKPIHRQRLHDDTGGKHKCLFGLAIKKLSQSLTRCLGVGQPRFSSPCICNARVHHKTAHVFGAAAKRFCVKTPAACVPGVNRITIMSRRLALRIEAIVVPSSTPATGKIVFGSGAERLTAIENTPCIVVFYR